MVWTAGPMRNVAIKIVSRAVQENDRIFWSDDVDLAFLEPSEWAVIGMAWRKLLALRIIARMNLHRKSKRPGSRGRTIFKYRLASEALAQQFLAVNAWTGSASPSGERLLFPVESTNL